MTQRRVKTTIGIERWGECIGVVHRSGVVKECGHFCYVETSINGRKVTAGGAEDRIYPFHSVTWEDIGMLQPKDMVPALGFCKDGSTYAFYYEGQVVEVGKSQTLLPVDKELWRGEWSLCGILRQFARAHGRLVQAYGIRKTITPESLQHMGERLGQLQQAILKVCFRRGERPHGHSLDVVGGLYEMCNGKDVIQAHVKRFIDKPMPFMISNSSTDAADDIAAEYIVATATKDVDWMATEGPCPICGEHTTITANFTIDGRLIGTCGDAFPIYKWISED